MVFFVNDQVVQDLLNCLDSPELPFLQWQESMAVLANRLPKDLRFEVRMQFMNDPWSFTLSFFQFCHIILLAFPVWLRWCEFQLKCSWMLNSNNMRQSPILIRMLSSLPSYWGGLLRSVEFEYIAEKTSCRFWWESWAIFVWLVFFQAHLSSCSEKDKATHERLVEPLMSLVKSHEGGRESHARVIVRSLFEEYLSVEELFSDNIQVFVLCLIYMKIPRN